MILSKRKKVDKSFCRWILFIRIFILLFCRFLKRNFFQLVGGYDPYSITTDYFGKISWFFSEIIVNCLNFWNIFPGNIMFLVSVIYFCFGARRICMAHVASL